MKPREMITLLQFFFVSVDSHSNPIRLHCCELLKQCGAEIRHMGFTKVVLNDIVCSNS